MLAVAEERLVGAEHLASPTRAPLDHFRKIIDDHHRSDSTRRTLDRWNDLDGVADRADRLCSALDRWNHWANGHNVGPTELTDVANALRNERELPGMNQVCESLDRWAESHGIDLAPEARTEPTISMGIDL